MFVLRRKIERTQRKKEKDKDSRRVRERQIEIERESERERKLMYFYGPWNRKKRISFARVFNLWIRYRARAK